MARSPPVAKGQRYEPGQAEEPEQYGRQLITGEARYNVRTGRDKLHRANGKIDRAGGCAVGSWRGIGSPSACGVLRHPRKAAELNLLVEAIQGVDQNVI